MTSATDPDEPLRKKPGREPERLLIAPEDAEDVLDRLFGKPPKAEEFENDEPADERDK